jgi:prophage maintenance system killer protein
MDSKSSDIFIYQSADGGLELAVQFREETIWLTQDQLSSLFDTTKQNISLHIKNIFEENELIENSVVKEILTTANDRKNYKTKHYNLDIIIAVGYRVNSKLATQFRQWSNKILKQYILEGYSINQKSLAENSRKLEEVQNTLRLITQNTKHNNLTLEEKANFLDLLKNYTEALLILNQFDEDRLQLGKGKPALVNLQIEDYRSVMKSVKQSLIEKQEATALFGQEYEGKFESIIGAINQTYDGKELYLSIEEKASHLLYFIIKDHPFADGNKRLGSFLFIYFLDQNFFLKNQNNQPKILDNTLVALALLVAQSNPNDKEIMIKLISKLLQG